MCVTLKVFERLYNRVSGPIMDYIAGVWGCFEYNSLDVVQHKAMRFFLGVSKFTPINMINALYGDIGWLMPKYRR